MNHIQVEYSSIFLASCEATNRGQIYQFVIGVVKNSSVVYNTLIHSVLYSVFEEFLIKGTSRAYFVIQLTYLRRMNLPTLISRTNPFPILGVLGGTFLLI